MCVCLCIRPSPSSAIFMIPFYITTAPSYNKTPPFTITTILFHTSIQPLTIMPLTLFHCHYDALLPSSLPYPSLSQRFYTPLSCPSLSAAITGMPLSHHHCHTLLLPLRISTSLWCPSRSSTITGMPSVHWHGIVNVNTMPFAITTILRITIMPFTIFYYHWEAFLPLLLPYLSTTTTILHVTIMPFTMCIFYYHWDALHYVYLLLSLGCPLSIVNTMPLTIPTILHINMMPFTIFYYTHNALPPSLWHLAVPPWSPSRVSTTIIMMLRKSVRHTTVNPKSVYNLIHGNQTNNEFVPHGFVKIAQ